MAASRIRKRCETCGATTTVRARERRCKQLVLVGLRSRPSYCWGALTAVILPRTVRSYQDVAMAKSLAAQRRFDELVQEIRRASSLLGKWQKRASYWAQRAHLTDEQLAEEREARKARAADRKGRRRKLALEGSV